MVLHNRWQEELILRNQLILELCLGENTLSEGLLLKKKKIKNHKMSTEELLHFAY